MKAIPKVESLCKPVIAYAHARKRAHISCTMIIVAFEMCMALLVHDVAIHIMAISSIGAWETLVITIGEMD
jgi:hypothetical protein